MNPLKQTLLPKDKKKGVSNVLARGKCLVGIPNPLFYTFMRRLKHVLWKAWVRACQLDHSIFKFTTQSKNKNWKVLLIHFDLNIWWTKSGPLEPVGGCECTCRTPLPTGLITVSEIEEFTTNLLWTNYYFDIFKLYRPSHTCVLPSAVRINLPVKMRFNSAWISVLHQFNKYRNTLEKN